MATSQHKNIYGGKDPRELPVYFIGEAAQYLNVPRATVQSWTLGRSYLTQTGSVQANPLIVIADLRNRMLSFGNLIELHVLSSITRVHRVDMRQVRRALKFLKEQFGWTRPLLEQDMLTDGKDLFVERYGQLVNVSRSGQLAMKQILELYLSRIDRDNHGVPIRLFPFTRRDETSPHFVAIDPRIQFGKPCISGTGIPTAIVVERYEAGDSLAELAKDYGRSSEEIEEAIRYGSRAAS